MGNCQASDAVATLIEYPNGRLERLYWTISARQVMLQNPGHYVGVYIWPKTSTLPKKKPRLKILPPSAILVAGHYYRLVTFEEVLENFSSKRGGKLNPVDGDVAFLTAPHVSKSSHKTRIFDDEMDNELAQVAMSQQSNRSMSNWRPSLQSISETL